MIISVDISSHSSPFITSYVSNCSLSGCKKIEVEEGRSAEELTFLLFSNTYLPKERKERQAELKQQKLDSSVHI